MDKIFSPIKGRVFDFLNNQSIGKEYFYKTTGITASNFKGKGALSEIGGDKIAKILTAFPQLSARWLIIGEGAMLRGENQARVTVSEPKRDSSICKSCVDKERTIITQADLISMLKKEIRQLELAAGGSGIKQTG
jgi:hypothetical protein